MTNGEIVGLVGGIVGILGGLFGTFLPMRSMKTPALRRWYLRTAAIAWCILVANCVFTIWMMRTRPQLSWIGWVFYTFMLLFGIIYLNRGVKRFQNIAESNTHSQTKERTNANGD